MKTASRSSSAPNPAAYGFYCAIEGKDFGASVVRQMSSSAEVAKVAHEVRERLQRVKASLAAPTTTPNQG